MEQREFKGSNGSVVVTPTKVILKYSRFLGSGKGEKEIRLNSISGIQLKKPVLTAGYIQFSFSGSSEQKGKSIFDAVKDENTIMCKNKQQYKGFVEAKELIEKYLNEEPSTNNFVSKPSSAEELKQFADLRDQGIITEEEFIAKKKQILGI
ncbi:SHOCT domain-containing protein [Bacillus sp. HSf4]|uniref:SHOCT domain-containing protein n=1 Tax=unclassified Bacillus (in: firmicutes) TaxID=185979 RepID=UPI00240A204A|nr:SHOCT domain-containing protein [Bacillus sp. HSf4]WFA04697.1 SHOCT domain-containing protein [Bacillus sp. HSf4]